MQLWNNMMQSYDRAKYGPQSNQIYQQPSYDPTLAERLERLELEAAQTRQHRQQQLQQQNQTQYYYLPNGKTCSVLHGYVNCY